MSEKSFWQFSLAAYSVVGVDRLLLRLQDEFGADSMINVIKSSAELGAENVVASMLKSLDTFVGDAMQSDDITMIALEKR